MIIGDRGDLRLVMDVRIPFLKVFKQFDRREIRIASNIIESSET